MKKILGVFLVALSMGVNAETKDCNGSGTVNMWLGSAAQTIIDHNSISTRRLEEISSLRKKKDGGRSMDKFANSYNCTFIARDPDRQMPDGLAGYLFTEKKFGSSVEDRINKGVPDSFQLWLSGGVRKLMAGGKGCYEVEYRDEQGDKYKKGYLLIDPQLPVPEIVNICN